MNGWRELAIKAVRRADADEPELLELLAQLLAEQDRAKQSLRERGYGCSGMPWAEMIAEVPERWQ